jgi:membrane protein DedA with SNARE-associated domain
MHLSLHWQPQTVYIFHLIYTYSYYILFPLTVIEGPVITVIAGFLASTNFLDPIPTFITILIANLTGDAIYYSAGRWWFTNSIRKLTVFFRIKKEKITNIENKLKKNSGKVIFFGKLSHVLGGLILVASGMVEVPFNKFMLFCLFAEVPKSLILLAVGYFFGSTISNYGKYLNLTFIGLIVLTVVLIALYSSVTYISDKIISKLEK